MPNLLPDWTLTLPWELGAFTVREAGRLIWSILLTGAGLVFFVALLKPPSVKRPFSTKQGIALFGVIIVGTLVLARFIPSLQRTIVWLGLGALFLHTLLMILSRKPRDPDRAATWAECFLGALAVFAMLFLAYAIVPNEWLEFANSKLEWGETSKFVFRSNEEILGFIPINYPFNFDYPALRDIVVTMIYVVFLGLNLKLWVMWQQRNEVKPAADDAAPTKRSRFGRPLQAWSARRAEATNAPEPGTAPSAPAPSGSA